MESDQTVKPQKRRNIKYSKLQKKRRKFFYSRKQRKEEHQQQSSKQKPPFPRWPINIDSIRLPKKKRDQSPPLSDTNTDDTSSDHSDRVLDTSLQKLHASLNTITSLQYKNTLDHAVDNATNMIYDVMEEIGKTERSASPPPSQPPPTVSNHLGYEDILLAALGANVPPMVIQRTLERMKEVIPLKDHVIEHVIHEACNPPDVFGAAGKSLVSMESIYGFFSPIEGDMTASLLPDETRFYQNEPEYMTCMRPSTSSVGGMTAASVERDFLNIVTDRNLPSGSL